MYLKGETISSIFISALTILFLFVASSWAIEKKNISKNITVISAPKFLVAEKSQPAGSLEIQVFGPDFIKSVDEPKFLIKRASDFDLEQSDIQLANEPLTATIPVRIERFLPGVYYVGIRVPPRKSKSRILGLPPTDIVEELAWDGACFESYRINSDASDMFIQRWYKISIEVSKTSIVSALFFQPSEALNLKLSQVATNLSSYKVNIKLDKSDLAFGVKRSMLPELLCRTGKVFIPEGFVAGTKGFDSIWYLSNTTSGEVAAAGRSTRDKSDKANSGQHFAKANSAVKKLENRVSEIKPWESDLGNNAERESILPPFDIPLKGGNEVRIRNPNSFEVTVALRTKNCGKDYLVASNGVSSVFVPVLSPANFGPTPHRNMDPLDRFF